MALGALPLAALAGDVRQSAAYGLISQSGAAMAGGAPLIRPRHNMGGRWKGGNAFGGRTTLGGQLPPTWMVSLGALVVLLLLAGILTVPRMLSEDNHQRVQTLLEGAQETHKFNARAKFLAVIVQIAVIDIVFSLDSVFTAVGLAKHVEIMVAAIVVAVGVMMFLAAPINEFIERHPTIKILALAFLILVGVALTGEAFEMHIPKGYLYFAMAFSFGVEMINIRMRERGRPVKLRDPDMPGERRH